jgi:hypothetical protein
VCAADHQFVAVAVLGFSAEIGLGEFSVVSLKAMAAEALEYQQRMEAKGANCTFSAAAARVVNFQDMSRALERRLRIQEIGEQTCIYLQARLRKFIACKQTRRDVLRRLEYIPASRTRGAFFLDSETNHPWYRWPRMCSNDRPASPATMGRRLKAEQRKRDARFEQYLKITGSSGVDCFR